MRTSTILTPAREAFRRAYRQLRACGSFGAAYRALTRSGQADAAVFLPAADRALSVRTERVPA